MHHLRSPGSTNHLENLGLCILLEHSLDVVTGRLYHHQVSRQVHLHTVYTYVNTCSSVDGREREREKERETFFQIANYSGLPPLPEYWWKLKERRST